MIIRGVLCDAVPFPGDTWFKSVLAFAAAQSPKLQVPRIIFFSRGKGPSDRAVAEKVGGHGSVVPDAFTMPNSLASCVLGLTGQGRSYLLLAWAHSSRNSMFWFC